MARRPPIRDLPFRHNDKPGLGFEIFRLSSLYARAAQRRIDHPLETPQRPEFHTLYLGISGRGRMIVDFTDVPLGARTLTFVARGRVQAFVPSRGVDAWMVLFAPEFLATSPGSADPLAASQLFSPLSTVPSLTAPAGEHQALLALAAQLDAEHARPLDPVQPWLLSALLRALLLRVVRLEGVRPPPPPALAAFLTTLERDHTTTRSVTHYAKAAGVSVRRLAEILVAETGKSTKLVIDERVALEIKRLLVHTGLSVKELAAQTGFVEPTNFVKFFRHHTGTTPLAFRRAHANR